MESIKNAITVVKKLEEKYGLSTEGMMQTEQDVEDFKVFVPLIGRFSAGKSALVNTVLGWSLEVCRENIGVATAIPTEVFYGDEDIACICRPEKEFISMAEYMKIQKELSTENADIVKLQLSDNEVLEKFPNVALVDMPGLDSGYEIHEKAIDSYIRKSMAFVLVFPADELTVPKSMEPILADLNAYDMPMCVVITKGNRIAGAEEQRKSELRSSLSKYFSGKHMEIFVTEKETGRIEDFVNFLVSMEAQASHLGKKYYEKKLKPEFAKVSNYLMGYLNNMDLSLSELEEQQEQLQDNMSKLTDTVGKELTSFTDGIPGLVNEVAGDVQAALSQKMEDLVFDLVHNSDVTASINETVRNTLTSSYQTRVTKNLKKHLNKISDVLSLGSANYASTMKIDIDRVCGTEISGIGRTAIAAIGLLLGGPLGGIIAHVIAGFINKNNSEKRKEAKMKICQQLSSNVFPAIDKEVREKVQMDLAHISLEVRQMVEMDVHTQMEALQKSLTELMEKKKQEDNNIAQKRIEIEQDVRLLGEAEAGIG